MARQQFSPEDQDPEQGLWQGRSVAHRFVSDDGLTILVGRNSADNDVVSMKLTGQKDFWMHVSGQSGSHVLIRNPGNLKRLPRETKRQAAGLAVRYSKAKAGGKTAVHLARGRDISKPRGAKAGLVHLARFETVQSPPLSDAELERLKENET